MLRPKPSVEQWGSDLDYAGETPDDVRPAYRFLIALYRLNLYSRATYWECTTRNKVAKMVIKRLQELDLI